MEADTLTRIDTTAQSSHHAYPDSTALPLNEWNFAGDTIPLITTKCWLQDTIQLYHQRNSLYFPTHHGIARTNSFMSESILLILILMEMVVLAYLIRNGLKLIGRTLKSPFSQNEEDINVGDAGQKSFLYHQFLWALTVAIFALMLPVILELQKAQGRYDLNMEYFLRFVLYVLLYFFVKYSICRIIGKIFFSPVLTERWLVSNKTIVSFFALSLTPVLICVEIGLQINDSFILSWIVLFFIITKVWQLLKTANIFSVRNGDFLYFILYLCALEIMPILLFYKGLFLI
ncbi:MAG: DUF4271 domain-containing protein [Bacteroidales bacterium]|nr:DUF4271 domain-containing protein [Bacteroidales bacterium]